MRTTTKQGEGKSHHLSDGKRAWTRMSNNQRRDYIQWITLQTGGDVTFTNDEKSFILISDFAVLGEPQ